MRTRRGFTLIEVLVVVAVIGIIVAVAIPNLLNALQRAKQKKSMADMRTLALTIESYSVDLNRYPAAAGYALPSGLTLPSTAITALQGIVTPTYLKTLPLTDGWSSWFTYSVTPDGQDYALRSNGSDGLPESTPSFGPTTLFNADIILCDGQFVQYPDGVQK
jgi:general secretion pathway protein G